MPVGRLVRQVADKSQVCTQRSWKRPYGVGLLVAGVDSQGPHLFSTCPSGNYYEYKAMAIGARSQVGGFRVFVRDTCLKMGSREIRPWESEVPCNAMQCTCKVIMYNFIPGFVAIFLPLPPFFLLGCENVFGEAL